MKPVIVTGLDIGSSRVSAVALTMPAMGAPAILAYESQPSKGVSRGAVVNMGEASSAVARVLGKICEKTRVRPNNICVNISGETIKGERSRGMIPLSSRGREVTRADMARCVNAAGTIRLAFDRDIIHKVVLNFSIDEQPAVKNPLGLYASRLYCEMYMITANLNHIQNIYKCVNNAGHDIKELCYSGIADALSVLEDEWKEEGVLLADIGASVTEVSIFSGGSLSYLDVIPLGAGDIKGTLKESVEFNNIISRLKAGREDFAGKGQDIKSVVITGGLAFNEGVVEVMEEKLLLPVKMGAVKNLYGDISAIDSIRGVIAIGLARYAATQYQPRRLEPRSVMRGISDKVTEIFNNYF